MNIHQLHETNCEQHNLRFISNTGSFGDEENWLAQYGQVVQSEHEVLPSFPTVELWDWEMLQETTRKKQRICRLTGRLVKPTSKLHPSMPAGGGLLKTAAICEVHLDFVGVKSGIYTFTIDHGSLLLLLCFYH